MDQYKRLSFLISRKITSSYSTSFSLATKMFDKRTAFAIYSIYGFVRIADEIVDTFHGFDKEHLLNKFEGDCFEAISLGISTNPVLNSFQSTVREFNISDDLIKSFIESMRYDLTCNNYTGGGQIESYIYGSAEVVGLMCLSVFCNGDDKMYERLKNPAMKLGSAFQKVNFLRDLQYDNQVLGRIYLADSSAEEFDEVQKRAIVIDIEKEFDEALKGIHELPGRAKLAVFIAYSYYRILLNKISSSPVYVLKNRRLSVSDGRKIYLLAKSVIYYKLKLI